MYIEDAGYGVLLFAAGGPHDDKATSVFDEFFHDGFVVIGVGDFVVTSREDEDVGIVELQIFERSPVVDTVLTGFHVVVQKGPETRVEGIAVGKVNDDGQRGRRCARTSGGSADCRGNCQ